MTILIILLILAAIAGGVWYYAKQHKDSKLAKELDKAAQKAKDLEKKL